MINWLYWLSKARDSYLDLNISVNASITRLHHNILDCKAVLKVKFIEDIQKE